MENRDKQTVIVISLPRADGASVKEALRKLSEKNSRSLSNQAMIILRDYLQKEDLL